MNFSLQPFHDATIAVQVHVVAALFALVIGAVVLFRRKGTPFHRLLGGVWMATMVVVAFSSLFIHDFRTFGPFSAIHLLSLWTFGTLVFALRAVRRGNIKDHRRSLIGLYVGGLIIAGSLTLLPGRTMHRIFFGQEGLSTDQVTGLASFGPAVPVVVALLSAGLVYLGVWFWPNRKPGRNRL